MARGSSIGANCSYPRSGTFIDTLTQCKKVTTKRIDRNERLVKMGHEKKQKRGERGKTKKMLQMKNTQIAIA